MKAIFLGPPGAGKGTQAAILAKKLRLAHLATGDMLRSAVKEGTELGRKADGLMRAGKLVPDELVIEMLLARLAAKDCERGVVLDGFPRNVAQAEALEKAGFVPDVVLNFSVDDEVLIERIAGRLVCSQCAATFHRKFRPPNRPGVCDQCGGETLYTRKDDTEEAVRVRLEVFHKEEDRLVEFYRHRKLLREFDADQAPEVVTQHAERLLKEVMS